MDAKEINAVAERRIIKQHRSGIVGQPSYATAKIMARMDKIIDADFDYYFACLRDAETELVFDAKGRIVGMQQVRDLSAADHPKCRSWISGTGKTNESGNSK
jgi:hypothetical protein